LRLAQQSVQRHALDFAGKVPQRDIEPGDRKHRDAIAAEQMQLALDLFHEGGDAGGVGHRQAANLRRDHLVDRGAGGSRADIGEGIAPAGDAGVGRDFDQHDIDRRGGGNAMPEAGHAGIIGNADMVRPDVRDQHAVSPFFECRHDPAWAGRLLFCEWAAL
jgi:hypothetical protein